ncbi:recombinase family protein [Cytobacillus oceanisediminis]|uniref:recombinase family protein n=1 Tax=Cytobacillus oceanisediminis TaxID=665099 RepID=UPI00203E59FE|nr:recombinase family protein [Cytobacillus oceanisediminis]MCM3241292.1 recombinase family protein [Cytobacillus oceanisediminis]
MKVGLYIRVSTEEQAKEGYSISAQKQKLKSFCISQDWEVAGLYADEGVSAKDINRPELKRMLDDIENNKIDCVLVYRLDRLTRSVFDLYKLLELFEKNNCKFRSSTEVYDTTSALGRMFITIVAALAQWERENMGERIAFGFAEKVRQGKYALNFRPIGYDLDLETGKLTINTSEAHIIKLIFDLYLKGYGANRICKYLNANEIKTKAGNNWNDKPLMQILKNPLYKGYIRWNDTVIPSKHDAIIEPEVFDHVQNIIVSRRTADPRRVSSEYIFSGKLKCNSCGNSLVGFYTTSKLSSGEVRKYRQYRCLKKKTGECKGFRNVSERKLEEAFLDYISKEDFTNAIQESAPAAEDILNKNNSLNDLDKDYLKKELEKIERRKKKWQYAWADDDDTMSYEDFKERMKEAKAEEDRIKELLSTTEVQHDENLSYSNDEIINALKNIKNNWEHQELNEKKNNIDSYFKQFHIDYVEDKLVITKIDFYD